MEWALQNWLPNAMLLVWFHGHSDCVAMTSPTHSNTGSGTLWKQMRVIIAKSKIRRISEGLKITWLQHSHGGIQSSSSVLTELHFDSLCRDVTPHYSESESLSRKAGMKTVQQMVSLHHYKNTHIDETRLSLVWLQVSGLGALLHILFWCSLMVWSLKNAIYN